ncbi:hypothetical protein H5410_062742 [Solanum commersonii]|uniref:Uncharacterized protein n=1 Tax=Solanum commersonii TaxID=4109 RepID=A0A9J5WD87_SOLCO|nr:hypothetical protein H5410_062742 [Solanum commersonii]
MLVRQSPSGPEDAHEGDADVKVDVKSDHPSGQDEGNKTEMVWTCEEQMHRRTSKEVRKVGYRSQTFLLNQWPNA